MELNATLVALCKRHRDVFPRRHYLGSGPDVQSRVVKLVNGFSGVDAVATLSEMEPDVLHATALTLRDHFIEK